MATLDPIHRLRGWIRFSLLVGLAGASTAAQDASKSLAPCVCDALCSEYVAPQRLNPATLTPAILAALHQTDPSLEASWGQRGLEIARNPPSGFRIVVPGGQPMRMDELGTWIEEVDRELTAGGIDPQRVRDLDRSMINGALHALDPYSRILPPVAAHALSEDLAGQFGGIGASLREEHGELVFDGIRPSLPADRAGMQDGDRLSAIGGQTATGMTLDAATGLIKGPPGSALALTIIRPASTAAIAVTLIRTEIPEICVRSCRIGTAGYIRLDVFSEHVGDEVRAALKDLGKDGPLSGLVLDLRHNGGGAVDQACEVSSLFLPQHSPIVRVVRGGQPAVTYRTARPPAFSAPLVVLVSRATASAAEIVAGTLQCQGRALLVGTVTHGKGLIQVVCALPDGGLFLCSTREYRLPGDLGVQGSGLQPDLALGQIDGIESPGACACDPNLPVPHRYLTQPKGVVTLTGAMATISGSDDLLAPDFTPDGLAQRVMDVLMESAAPPAHLSGSPWMDQTVAALSGSGVVVARSP